MDLKSVAWLSPPPGKPTRKYRPAKQLPFELREHCGIYLEEQLCESHDKTVTSIH